MKEINVSYEDIGRHITSLTFSGEEAEATTMNEFGFIYPAPSGKAFYLIPWARVFEIYETEGE